MITSKHRWHFVALSLYSKDNQLKIIHSGLHWERENDLKPQEWQCRTSPCEPIPKRLAIFNLACNMHWGNRKNRTCGLSGSNNEVSGVALLKT